MSELIELIADLMHGVIEGADADMKNPRAHQIFLMSAGMAAVALAALMSVLHTMNVL